jgi:hypothetical protein
VLCPRRNWRIAREPTGDLKHGSLDEDRDGVEVSREGRKPEPHCLEGYGPPSTERVEHLRKVAIARAFDFGSSLSDDPRVVGCLPRHKSLEDVEETFAFHELVFFSGEYLGMSRRVVNE